jgi:hypothetical protein
MSALDEVSRLLGRMEQELISLRRDHQTLLAKMDDMKVQLEAAATAAGSFPSIVATVDRHEALVQKGAGVVVVLTAISTTFGLFAKDIAGWLGKKFGWF